jgi:hypothetical protein
VIHAAQCKLLEIVFALRLPRGLAGRLHGGQQERDQNADDRDHHKKFHERKGLEFPIYDF